MVLHLHDGKLFLHGRGRQGVSAGSHVNTHLHNHPVGLSFLLTAHPAELDDPSWVLRVLLLGMRVLRDCGYSRGMSRRSTFDVSRGAGPILWHVRWKVQNGPEHLRFYTFTMAKHFFAWPQ